MHDSDVTSTWYRIKSLGTRLVVQQLVHGNDKRKHINIPHYWPLWRESTSELRITLIIKASSESVECYHDAPVTRKAFPYHNIISDHIRYVIGQWEEALHSNASSHWPSTYPEWSWIINDTYQGDCPENSVQKHEPIKRQTSIVTAQ